MKTHARRSQQSLHGVWRRVRKLIRQLSRPQFAKAHDVHVVQIGSRRYKRIRFGDAAEAIQIENNLDALSVFGCFPRLVHREGDELWVDFIEGQPLDVRHPSDAKAVIDFYANLYSVQPELRPVSLSGLDRRFECNLDFLAGVGLLSSGTVSSLLDHAACVRPDKAWFGFEYIDPVDNNFLVGERALHAIDVEALRSGRLLGIGIAKARMLWLRIDRAELLEALRVVGAPDISGQFSYANLCFLAEYGKQKYLQGKGHRVAERDFLDLIDGD